MLLHAVSYTQAKESHIITGLLIGHWLWLISWPFTFVWITPCSSRSLMKDFQYCILNLSYLKSTWKRFPFQRFKSEVWFSASASPSALLPLLSLNFKDISASREAEIMFGNCILAADLTKTYYFATVPEIADRLCVSNVCIPVYLCACVGRVQRAERLLIKVLYVWLNISQPEHWVHYVSVCVRALLDGILMALKLKHDPAVDDVSLPKAQTLYQTSCQQMSLLEIGGEAARGILYMLVLHKIVHCDDIYQKINRLKH